LAGPVSYGPRRRDRSGLRRARRGSARLDRRSVHAASEDDHRAAGADLDHFRRGVGGRRPRARPPLQQDARLLPPVQPPGGVGWPCDGQPHPTRGGREHGRRCVQRATGARDSKLSGRASARHRAGELRPGGSDRRHARDHLLLHCLRRRDHDASRQDPSGPHGPLRRVLTGDDGAHLGHHKVPAHRGVRAHH